MICPPFTTALLLLLPRFLFWQNRKLQTANRGDRQVDARYLISVIHHCDLLPNRAPARALLSQIFARSTNLASPDANLATHPPSLIFFVSIQYLTHKGKEGFCLLESVYG